MPYVADLDSKKWYLHSGDTRTMSSPDNSVEDRGEIRRLGDQFLASLNHEIRTPLSGILGMVDLLMETELTEEQADYVSTTRLCADQLLEMLNSALEYTALSSGNITIEKAEFDLPKTLEAVVEEFRPKAEAKGLQMTCRLEQDVPAYATGDAIRLRQALSPLVANAVKFTPQGTVEVTASAFTGSNGRFLLALDVRDTGIGIPPERLKIIFDAFQQLESGLSRSYAGMGLGLAVTKKLVGIMGGDLAVESEPGAGSVFRLTVPLDVPRRLVGDGGSPAAESGESALPRILMVDDNDVARRIVTHILKRAGYDIQCAAGGREAIEAALEKQFDLILMDLQMPTMNGLEATEAIRALPGYGETPILALSANYSDEFIRTCHRAGFQDFLSKPVQQSKLLGAVKIYLKK